VLRVAIVAHGRFHAFDLARELRDLGHDVALFSNYPAWAVERFGIRREDYSGLWSHGGVERVMGRLAPGALRATEATRHRWFGRWAARALDGHEWDVVCGWSGVSEEWLTSARIVTRCRLLMRGSAHIVEQAMLLAHEERRVGASVERPSDWMIAREQREYEHAGRILVPSEFARASFGRHGIGGDRVSVLPLGVDVAQFRASAAAVEARIARILGGGVLRVLFVGTLSARKGLHDLVATARACEGLPMEFTLVGPTLPETRALLHGAGPNVTVLERREQRALPELYARADVFLFPTIEDGFGMVLTQAAAAGLLVLATPNCAAPEILAGGAPGWILPIRNPEAFAERLRWCHAHRDDVAAMLRSASTGGRTRTWTEVAVAFANGAHTWMSSTRCEGVT
jgi:glycosyltransferase involved in cell wall biosynthesis